MSHGTVRLRNANPEDNDGSSRQTVIGEMGYEWHFGPNESKVIPDNAENRTLAANATVKLGTTVQQAVAPEVLFDGDDNNALT
jgi:hypothetical protein